LIGVRLLPVVGAYRNAAGLITGEVYYWVTSTDWQQNRNNRLLLLSSGHWYETMECDEFTRPVNIPEDFDDDDLGDDFDDDDISDDTAPRRAQPELPQAIRIRVAHTHLKRF
jgi:hypothetical protein